MKKHLIILLIMGCVGHAWVRAETVPQEEMKGSISLSGAWALYPMAVKWAEEFEKIHPGAKIDVSAGGAGKGMADALAGVVDIGMVSRSISPAEVEKGAWAVAVTKDAVVPTVNENNPVIKELLARGTTRDNLIGIWISGRVKDFGTLSRSESRAPIHVYTRSDACGAAQVWAEYLGKKQEDLQGTGVYGDPGLAQAVQNDLLGIGYNNINYAYDGKTKLPVKGIKILPLDLNADGLIDPGENFYRSSDEIVKAVNDGRYPSPPARELYLVCRGKPGKQLVRAFLKWVLTDGQKYVPETGYINLPPEKLKGEVDKLEGKQ